MHIADRVNQLPEYPFVTISRTIAAKKAQGIDVISFGIGDPDRETPGFILDALDKGTRNAPNHRYPESEGLPEFRKSVTDWYERRFGVKLDPETEAISLIGAKEGIGHAALAFLNPGDVAIMPDPAYPVYDVGTIFAGGVSYKVPMHEEAGWLVDLDDIPSDVARNARIFWLNYPNNPTGGVAPLEYFNRVVEYAKSNDLIVLHDNCYSEIVYDGYEAASFLQADGAMDVGMEFHSLSKTFNMTGWRVGAAVGNADLVEALRVIKSNLDSGVPQAVQEMAIEALDNHGDWVIENNRGYQDRRDRVVDALRSIGLAVIAPQAGLYVWTRVPEGYTSEGFANALLEERDIVVTPGSSYGESGEGYIRLSLTLGDDRVDEGLSRLRDWKIPPPPAR
ncbi:MAG: LL-diaminopimelate aminotransferase [Dehalococcoidia bacterium]|jgi:LL-diaminopimelate aminotransferase|nr:LL-diaminopimelate aminotransferase [Dehalococcoidia bacterium]